MAVIVALVGVAFFFIGVADGTVSGFNIVSWTTVLPGLTAIVLGSRVLANRGQLKAACVLAAALALPGLLYALFMVIAVTSGVRWNRLDGPLDRN